MRERYTLNQIARGGDRDDDAGAGVVVVVAMVGIMAAIAIPSLLRARVAANEPAAIGDLRTFTCAQATYATANQGLFDSRDECLIAPAACVPLYSGPKLLAARITQLPGTATPSR